MEEADLKPLVSIIIPVYNSAGYLAGAVTSCINQTWPNIEVIIVDDGSTDSSLTVAESFENDKIKVYQQENKNAASARNYGLGHARGDFIQFLDADDMLSPNKIEAQVCLLLAHPDNVAVCSTVHFSENKNHREFSPCGYEEAFLIDAAPFQFLINLYGGNDGQGSMIQPNAWLCPREIIKKAGPWNEDLTLDDDGEYFCRVLLSSAGVLRSGGQNYYRKYNQSKNLSSAADKKHLYSQYRSLTLKISWLTAKNPAADLKKIHARWLYALLFKAYPGNAGLSKQINSDIRELNITYKPAYPFATPAGQLLCKVLGWKLAKLIQGYKHMLHL